jgi:hypothetical protein
MGLRGKGRVGPVEASVAVKVAGQKWANTFSVRGMVLGSHFPKNHHIRLAQAGHDGSLNISGKFYSEQPDDLLGVEISRVSAAGSSSKSLEEIFRVGQPTVSTPTPIGRFFYRDIVIPIEFIDGVLEHLGETRTVVLVVLIITKDAAPERSHFIDVVLVVDNHSS